MGPTMRACVNRSGEGVTMATAMTIAKIAQRLFLANVLGDNSPMRININKTIGS